MTASFPRPVLLGIVGVALFAGLFMFTRSRSTASDSSATAPVTSPAAPGATATTTPADPGTAPAADTKTSGKGIPAPVARALDAKKVVVLLFWNRRAVDDRSVHNAVAGLSHHGGKVAVFDDRVGHLSNYTRITATAQVNQTPALVIIDRRGGAEVETGYLDRETIQQFVDTALTR
jgi:hypothetical protein